jgi:hypothetical protein
VPAIALSILRTGRSSRADCQPRGGVRCLCAQIDAPRFYPLALITQTRFARARPREIDRYAPRTALGPICADVLVSVRVSGRALRVCVVVALVGGCSNSTTPLGETSPVIESIALACEGFRADPPPEFTVLFDAVALPTSETYPSALQTNLEPDADPAGRLFAKTGLFFRPGHDFEIAVPDQLRDRISIGWAQRAWRVTDPACPGSSQDWTSLVGGYWVAETMCADLIVRSGSNERHVSIGLGTPCPGQTPPQGPSQS